MSYWRDLMGVSRGFGLVSRAFFREQSRVINENWATGSIQELVDRSVKTGMQVTNNLSNTAGIQETLKDTMERVQTVGRSFQQGATSILFNRSQEITSIPSDISKESSIPVQPPPIAQSSIGLDKSIETEMILNLPQEIKSDIFVEKLGSRIDPAAQRQRVEEILEKFPSESIGGHDQRSSITLDKSMETEMIINLPKEIKSDIFKEKFGPPIDTVPQGRRLESIGDQDHRSQAEKVQIEADRSRRFREREELKDRVKLKSDQKPIGQKSMDEVDVLLSPPQVITAELSSQKLSETSRERRVPSSRIGRAATFANLAVGLAAGTVAEMTRNSLGLSQNDRSGLFDNNPILSEANAERIVNTLCRVRGAALKLGQMLSIQDNSMISPQIQRIFERVRYSADFMPKKQVEKVLISEWGDDWRSKFSEFDERPFAAASIGQVHKGILASNGMEVAVKIQYPGVAESIDSDINNLVSVLTFGNILPRGLYLESFIKVAKVELAQECDYLLEAHANKRFKSLLAHDPEFHIPSVVDELTTRAILCTELIYGLPVDKCVDLDQDTRSWIGKHLLEVCLRELFEFNFMQTDPNWANFFYNTEKKQLTLLDFGASREFGKKFVKQYMKIIKAAAENDREKVLKFSTEIGFLTGYESKVMQQAHCDAVLILGEPFRDESVFDFGLQNITPRIQQLIPVLVENRLTPPPEEIYSLHRKLSGAFLLCAKLKSKIRCKPLFDKACSKFVYSGDQM